MYNAPTSYTSYSVTYIHCTYVYLFFSIALTTENVLRVLKEVWWAGLCSILSIPNSQQKKIVKKFGIEVQGRTAAVSFYLQNYPHASWRNIIRSLDWRHQHHEIHHYAEKLTGMLKMCFYELWMVRLNKKKVHE